MMKKSKLEATYSSREAVIYILGVDPKREPERFKRLHRKLERAAALFRATLQGKGPARGCRTETPSGHHAFRRVEIERWANAEGIVVWVDS